MKVLLTNPFRPKITESPFSLPSPMMPLGLGFIAAVLEQKGHQVVIFDNYLWKSDIISRCRQTKRFKSLLESWKPDFVGISTYTGAFHKTLELISLIKNTCSAKIVCGGSHASVMPETFPDTVDFIVRGEGEFAMLDIVEGRIIQRIIKTERINDLDNLPMIAWHLFEHKRYKIGDSLFFGRKPIFNLNTSRGCPFRCSFCSIGDIWGNKYKMFSASRIVRDIEYLIDKYRIRGVYFREDNFTAHRQRVKEFCNLLLSKNIDIEWACETRVDTLDMETMKIMKEAGCRGLYVGVESGSQKVLDSVNKGIKVEQIIDFFSWCKKLQFKTVATFCFGTPLETEEDRVLTEELIEKIKPDCAARAVYIGIPRSKLYNYLLETKQYYRIDENGLLYPKGYQKLAARYYRKNERRYIP